MLAKSFFTRKKSNAGVKLPLETPDGKKTDEWLLVAGIYSDAFRAENRRVRKLIVDEMSYNAGQSVDALIESHAVELVASLIVGWSFEKPLTREAAIELMTEAHEQK